MATPYPVTIVSDRYGGTYSGGNYTAWNLHICNVPEEIDADDVTCSNFWFDNDIIVGKGTTSQNAYDDLNSKLET